MFHSYFERKIDKVLTFNIVHFPNFEISDALKALHLTVSKFNKRRGCLLEKTRYLNFSLAVYEQTVRANFCVLLSFIFSVRKM